MFFRGYSTRLNLFSLVITLIFVSQCVNCQSSKKVLSVSLGQVDFLAGHVTFKDYLPNWQGPRQIIQGGVWGRVE